MLSVQSIVMCLTELHLDLFPALGHFYENDSILLFCALINVWCVPIASCTNKVQLISLSLHCTCGDEIIQVLVMVSWLI